MYVEFFRVWLIFLNLTILFSQLSAQTHSETFKHLNSLDGLPSDMVLCSITDKQGYIWIGTENGLCRYDGFRLKLYTKNNRQHGLNSNHVTAMALQSDGRIWLGYYDNGIDLFDPTSEKVVKSFSSTQKDNPNTSVPRIMDLKIVSNYLVIGLHSNFIDVLDIKSYEYISCLKFIASDSAYFDLLGLIHTIDVDPKDPNLLWITTGGGLIEWKIFSKTWNLHQFNNEPLKAFSIYNSMRSTVFLNDSIAYIGTWGAGIVRYNVKSKTWRNYLISDYPPLNGARNVVRRIEKKSAEVLYVATHDSGLVEFNMISNQYQYYPRTPDNLFEAPNSLVNNLYITSEKILLVCHSTGLSIKHPDNQYTERFYLPEQKLSLNKRLYFHYNAFYDKADEQLYVGTIEGDGLLKYDKVSVSWSVLRPNHASKSLRPNNFVAIKKNQNGKIFALTFRDGLYEISGDSLRRPEKINQVNFAEWSGYDIILDKKGNGFIVNPNKGILAFNQTLKTAKIFQKGYPNLETNNFFSGCLLNDTELLLGSDSSLLKFNIETQKITRIAKKLPKEAITRILKVNEEEVWVSTLASGVYKINVKQDSILQHLEEINGLLSNNIMGIALDRYQNLWIGTNRGFQCYNTKNNHAFILNSASGLCTNNISYNFSITEDNYVNHSIPGVLLRFSIDSVLQLNSNGKKPIITNVLSYNNQPILSLKAGSWNFVPGDNIISVYFSTLDFKYPEGIKYRYKLVGYDKDWFEPNEKIPTARYTKIPPGRYTFLIEASEQNGAWTGLVSESNFIFEPFWYQTTIFKTLVILLVLASIFITYKLRVKHLQKQAATRANFEKRIIEVRLDALRSQMNPHFMFNSLNSVNHLIIKGDNLTASEYLIKFSRLLRRVLNNSRSDQITLQEEIETIKLYLELERKRFSNAFDFSINVADEIITEEINIPPMMVQPYVENSIWHGLMHLENKKGTIAIDVEMIDNNLLSIKIEDNGIGRKAAAENQKGELKTYKSHGLKITKERMELLEKKFDHTLKVKIEDKINPEGIAEGTIVWVTLQVGN